MSAKFHRVLYRQLPEDRDWTVADVGGEQVIIINEALDKEGRKRAHREARASITGKDAGLAIIPIAAGAAWLRDRLQSPMGAAIVASTVTMAGAYAINQWEEPPRAAPQVVITLAPTPTPSPTPSAEALSTASPERTRGRPTRGPGRREPTAAPTRAAPTRERSTPTAAPTRAPQTRGTRDEPPRDEPTIVAVTGDPDPPAADPEPTPSGPVASDPPGGDPAPADPGPGDQDDPPAADDPPALAGQECGGIHVGVPLDPLLGVDVCLLG